jgi:hypothetical protein
MSRFYATFFERRSIMKRLILLLALIAVLGPPVHAQRTLYLSPDVPTDDPGGSATIFLPWDVIEYKGGAYNPTPAHSFPANTAVDALHKMDRPNHWLLSVEAPATLGATTFQPEDVILFDGANYFMYFDGSAQGVPPGVNVDAVFLETDDFGDLIISFDVPTTIGANTYEPADLVRYTGIYSLYYDASAVPPGVALSDNVTAADAIALLDLLLMDIPSDLAPSIGPVTYVPGDIAQWDGVNFNLYTALNNWPLSSEVDAFSCQANPGRVYDRSVYQFPITLGKSTIIPGNIVIYWAASCSWGAEDYGIYEGTLLSWYSHTWKLCIDVDGFSLSEDFTPGSGDTYYLVVPHDFNEEGAYGLDFDPTRVPPRIERPQPTLASDRCYTTQVVTACP